jgi:hypothetical protein
VEANANNYQFSSWNDTDTVEAMVEGTLGSFTGELPKQALAQYAELENWTKYSAMISDIRTVCPLEGLVTTMKETYSFPTVSFYVATEARRGDEGLETGNVADPGMDMGAILGLLGDESSRFQDSLQRKFLFFVKGHVERLHRGVTLFGEQISRTNSLARCGFWRNTSDTIVPSYGRRF